MMQSDDQGLFRVCFLELPRESFYLGWFEMTAGRYVGVDGDDRQRFEIERPLAVGQRLRVPAELELRVIDGDARRLLAEVFHEPRERGFLFGFRFAVMVAWE